VKLGLCGAHRTGKTTLAAEFAKQQNVAFVRTTTSEVFAQHNLDPAKPMDFATRLWIQHKVLDAAEAIWQAQTSDFVTDRTPLDMLAYTLADVKGDTVVDMDELDQYMLRCFESTERFFDRLVLIQPGIPLVFEPGKAALNEAYIEALNTIITGLMYDERQELDADTMPRPIIDLQERVDFLRDDLEWL